MLSLKSAIRTVAVAFIAGLTLQSWPAQSGAATVGANLNRPANATYGCETLPSVNAFGGRFFLPSGVNTCTYVSVGSLGGTSEVAQAPSGGGLVTRVRVKTGPTVGPVQATVSRASRNTIAGFACCFFAGASQVFTPQPNTVTQIPVRLPVRSDLNPDPQVGETVDYLGITVLAPNVPIPAHEVGNPGDLNNPGAAAFFPHLGSSPNDTISGRVDGAGVGGVQPLISADILPFCGAARARRAAASGSARVSAGSPCAPVVGLRRPSGRVRGRRVLLDLLCNVALPCRGRVLLQSRRTRAGASASARRRAGRKRRRAITYASARVAIQAGGRKRITAKLSKAGLRLLRRRKRARAWANTRLPGATPSSANRRIVLRR